MLPSVGKRDFALVIENRMLGELSSAKGKLALLRRLSMAKKEFAMAIKNRSS